MTEATASEVLPLAVTMGEPAGIGGEIVLKAWLESQARPASKIPSFFVVDDPNRLSEIARSLPAPTPIETIEKPEDTAQVFTRALPVLPLRLPLAVSPGSPQTANAEAVLQSIRLAVQYCLDQRAAGVVTNPIRKITLYESNFRHAGHTEFLAELCGPGHQPVMMLSCPGLRVVPVTVHCAIRDAIGKLTTELIVQHGKIVHRALKKDFGIVSPRLAVAGLNPHAGENGSLGTEETDIIQPAIEQLKTSGIEVIGPAAPDSLFHPVARSTYDACLCMYHDQALIPIKTIDFDHGVNSTLGLPIVRTSPDHGTALDIAGQGKANPASLIAALKQATEMSTNRARYD